jgi:hypothetical protein
MIHPVANRTNKGYTGPAVWRGGGRVKVKRGVVCDSVVVDSVASKKGDEADKAEWSATYVRRGMNCTWGTKLHGGATRLPSVWE